MTETILRWVMWSVLGVSVFTPLKTSSGQLVLPAPDGTEVTVHRDAFGVPHIVAQTEEAAFFAQGFVTGVDRLVQLEQARRLAEGRVSEIPLLGGPLGDSDRMMLRDFYRPDERQRQFDELDARFKIMIQSYSDGVNRFLDSMEVNPDRYRPPEVVFFEALGLEIEPWTVLNTVAVSQAMLRQFGQFGGEELERLVELQANGQEWFDKHRPINDPAAPTTVPGTNQADQSSHAKRAVRGAPKPPSRFPTLTPEVIRSISDWEDHVTKLRGEHGIPNTFGSFAVLVAPSRTSAGGALLLGAPQMLEPDSATTSIVYEIEIQSPTLHVAGVSVAGVPGVLIGRNAHAAWSLTSGISDNTDIFIETTEDTTFGRYWYEGEWLDFEVFVDTIGTGRQAEEYVHYRTVHGPVIGDDLTNRQVYSKQMASWDNELRAFDAFDRMWRATSIDEFEQAAAIIPLAFNVFYADIEGNTAFWHVGRFRDSSDGIDPRLPRLGDGSEEWIGFIPFTTQPRSINPAQGYLVNWNNKPSADWDNGDNVPWAFENELDTQRAVDRVLVIDEIVRTNPAFSFEDLKEIPLGMTEECQEQATGIACYTRGTYEQLFSLVPGAVEAVNILPPGQTASPLLAALGRPGPHANDQWTLFTDHKYKPMAFGAFSPVSSDGENPEDVIVGVSTYPNPFERVVTFEILAPPTEATEVVVFDVLGRRVRTVAAPAGGAERTVEIDFAGLGAGLYHFRVRAGSTSSTGTVVKVR